MTNHVHLLVTPTAGSGVSRMMQFIGRRYVRHFNDSYQRTGTLWEGRFRSSLVQYETYLLACQRYIELNPVRAGMVSDPSHYHWSSYCANGMGVAPKLWTPHPVYQQLGKTSEERIRNYRALFDPVLDQALLPEIRFSLNKGLILGSRQFREEIAALSGIDSTPGRRGRRTG